MHARIDNMSTRLSSDASRYFARAVSLWVLIAACVSVEAWLALTWLPTIRPFGTRWATIGATSAMLILPLVAAAAFFRLSIGKKYLRRRYVIKPVQCARASSTYNGQAISSALFRELSAWQQQGENATLSSPAGVTLSLSHVSVPLSWLWDAWRRILIGSRDVIVEGTLIDTDGPFRLVVCATPPGYASEYPSRENEPFSSELDKAVRSIALDLINELDPDLRAYLHEKFEEFDAAIRLVRQQPPTLARDLYLAELLLASHRHDLAKAHLQRLQRDHFLLSWSRRTEVLQRLATVEIKIGEFCSARFTLQNLIRQSIRRKGLRSKAKARELLTLLGRCDCDDGRFSDALTSLSHAQELGMNELRRLTRLPEGAELAECLRHCEIRPSGQLDTLLIELSAVFELKATCKRLQRRDPFEEYDSEMRILRVKNEMTPDHLVLLQMAHVIKYAAVADVQEQRLDDALQRFDEAFEWYERAVKNFPAVDPGDFGTRTALAWCECGKLVCKLASLTLKPVPSLPQHAEDGLQLAIRLVELLSDQDRHRFGQLLDRATQLTDVDSADYRDALAQAAAILTSGVLQTVEANNVPELLQDIASIRISTSGSVSAVFDKGVLQQAYERHGLALASVAHEAHTKYELFTGVIWLCGLFREAGAENTIMLQQQLRLEDTAASIRQSCLETFQGLTDSRYHEAEYAYGLACLHAILCDRIFFTNLEPIKQVAEHLRLAIELSSTEATKSEYIGRAKTDPDFDPVRGHPDIQALLRS